MRSHEMDGQIKGKIMSKRMRLIILLGIVTLAMGGYLAASRLVNGIGFPLDDAWIHQTYARNFVLSGLWAYQPGVPSAGSTAPLWSLLLAFGYMIQAQPYLWTYLLGGLGLLAVAWMGEEIFRQQTDFAGFPWFGLFLAAEWHLVWAAASGMETLLFATFTLAVFACLSGIKPAWAKAGAIIGILTWVRPDGVTLLGPALLLAFLVNNSWRKRWVSAGLILGTFLLGFIPYLGFNWLLGGSIWPNTYYAKQAEYAILIQSSIWQRYLRLAVLPAIGAGSLLLPAIIYGTWQDWTKQSWGKLLMLVWWLGYTGVYALRLPVDYQHGRYLMPAMPVFFLLGAIGFAAILRDLKPGCVNRILQRVWLLAIVGVAVGFYGIGAVAYARDVAIIQTEMVRVANWVAENTQPNDIIAAHDIGALGYFGQRKIIDLAGLVSPEVIPFIRDEGKLADYLNQQGTNYLVTFPDWYQHLTDHGSMVFQTDSKYTRLADGQNMAVYRWNK